MITENNFNRSRSPMVEESTTVLDRKHVNRMLVHILRTGEVGSMDFTWMTTNWRIVDDNLGAMVEAGLLNIHIPQKGRKTLRYSLTEKGKIVAIAEVLQQECIRGRFAADEDIVGKDLLKLWDNSGKLRHLPPYEDVETGQQLGLVEDR